jgi:hypothetical protein
LINVVLKKRRSEIEANTGDCRKTVCAETPEPK